MARLRFFGRLQDVAGASTETVALPDGVRTAEALRAWLEETRGLEGALADASVRIAVNAEIAQGDVAVSDDDEIAFLPPVGGG